MAGLGPIDWADRRMHNLNLTDVVNGHRDYINKLHIILKAVGIRTTDEVDFSRSPPGEGQKRIGTLAVYP